MSTLTRPPWRHTSRAMTVAMLMSVILLPSGWASADPAPDSPQHPATVPSEAASQAAPYTRLGIDSARTTEMANHIGAVPLIARLSNLPEGTRCPPGGADRLDVLTLRQEIAEAVLSASLETDHVLGDIANELMYVRMAREALQSRQDRYNKISNVAAIVTGGALGVIGTALQFGESTANVGNAISIGGGGASVVLSLLGVRQLPGGQQLSADVPAMLAEPLAASDSPPDHQEYSRQAPVVWAYLNAVPPAVAPEQVATTTRLQSLREEWTRRGLIDDRDPQEARKTIDALTGTGARQPKLSIELLDARAAMLIDVYANVAAMKHSLSMLVEETRRMFACSDK